MHSVKRVRTTAEAQAAKKRKEASKIIEYNALVERVGGSRKNEEYSSTALQLTTTLLKMNPEFYTIWNYRREILLHIFQSLPPAEITARLDSELDFLFSRLREFPKCYWIWNHRRWCLNTSPAPDYARELKLVTMMLERDARNFHGWQYRRGIVACLESRDDEKMKWDRSEFEYTTAKINNDFSNFSAWHNRTKLIPRLVKEDPELDARELLKKEIYLITQAIYTDPDDQSVWLYHRWLVTSSDIVALSIAERTALLHQEITSISELLAVEPDSKWCLHSLAFYKNFLADLTGQEIDKSVGEYLEKLETIDPMRRKRYQDWRARISL
ncbi:rab geranylgeranyltransferase alpha subunit [Myxozyma melibiosi]|uniref:Geranylgeranyl transferase type-2 subunit alpha n=1 Tax=Myxozyma melibiosi TaxID=54550 RepID=A0ABR1EYR2_9ASCO